MFFDGITLNRKVTHHSPPALPCLPRCSTTTATATRSGSRTQPAARGGAALTDSMPPKKAGKKGLNFDLLDQLVFYGAYHSNPINQGGALRPPSAFPPLYGGPPL
jgi:hypothetical protein